MGRTSSGLYPDAARALRVREFLPPHHSQPCSENQDHIAHQWHSLAVLETEPRLRRDQARGTASLQERLWADFDVRCRGDPRLGGRNVYTGFSVPGGGQFGRPSRIAGVIDVYPRPYVDEYADVCCGGWTVFSDAVASWRPTGSDPRGVGVYHLNGGELTARFG